MARLRALSNPVVGFVAAVLALTLSAGPGLTAPVAGSPEPTATSPSVPLEQVLRPDGTLDLHGYRGSVATAGWRMRMDASGAPRFEREAESTSPAGADPTRTLDAPPSAACWKRFGSVNGNVYAVAVDGSGNLYAGGDFTAAGNTSANYIAKWDGTSWSALGTGMNNWVFALAIDKFGNLYAGGAFSTAGGVSAICAAKWNGATWSALGAGMNTYVYALAVDDAANLYAGGGFTTAGDLKANYIAKWDGTSWSALGSGMDLWVYALAVDPSGNLYAGGIFSTAGGTGANRVAKWNGTTWSALGIGASGAVYALAVDGSDLYAGGSFTSAGGVSANRVARWNGASWSALGTGMNSTVHALSMDGGGNLYAGGDFTTAGGSSANEIAKWNGSAWSALGAGANGRVAALAALGADVYVGGYFATAGGAARSFLARWDGASTWSSLTGGMNNSVTALAADGGGNLYAGGGFTTAGGVSANYVAKWDGASWSALGTGMNNLVKALVVDASGNLYAGGNFTTAGGVSAGRIARWDGTSWSALGTGVVGSGVLALTLDGSGNLYAGGTFTTAGGVSASNIAKWNGTSWSALGSGTNGQVRALAVDGGGNLYAGGEFTIAGGVSASHVAKWNGTSWSTLGTGTNNAVYALAVDGSNLYAVGGFVTAGGVSANYVAKWSGASWSALGTGMNSSVYALAAYGGGHLFAGGFFSTAGGVSASYIAQWDGTSWWALDAGMDGIVSALVLDGGNLYAGGSFTSADGYESDDAAELHLRFLYRDADGDGFGDSGLRVHRCSGSLSGYVADSTDCDDSDAVLHPGPEATCDGIDNDCDAAVDEDAGACGCVENRPGLAGWWRAGGSAADAAAGNHGTLMGGAGYATGQVGQAFSLNGTDAYVANLGDAYSYAFLENTGVFTINAWISLNDPNAASGQAITASAATFGEKGHYFTWDNGPAQLHRLTLAMMDGTGTPVISSSSPNQVVTTSGWHHVAAVGNGTTVTFYVDGVAFAGTGTMGAKPSGPSTQAVDIGRCPYFFPVCMFDGLIDELEIHDRALSASEIRAIYDAGANGMCGTGCLQSLGGLAGWWPANGDGGDRSAFNNHGTPGGGTSFAAGKVGQAFSLNSTSYVDVPDNASLEFPTQFTLAAWIRPDAVNNSCRIISRFGAGNYAYEMLFSSNNSLQLRADISNDGVNSDALISPTSLSVGVWAHVATTFDLGTWKLYVNGSEVASTVSAMTTIFVDGSSPLSIGRVPAAGLNFIGLIDEPMVFNRALSPAEVGAIYQSGSSGMCGLVLTGVDEPAAHAGSLELAAPWPNPAARVTNVRFRLPAATAVRAEVFDVAGRRVITLLEGERLDPGEHRLTWDGRDASGRRAATGLYQVRVTAGGAVAVRRIVMIE